MLLSNFGDEHRGLSVPSRRRDFAINSIGTRLISCIWQKSFTNLFLSLSFPGLSLKSNHRPQTTLQMPGLTQLGSSCPLNTRPPKGALGWGTQRKSRSGPLLQVNLLLRNHRFEIVTLASFYNLFFSVSKMAQLSFNTQA